MTVIATLLPKVKFVQATPDLLQSWSSWHGEQLLLPRSTKSICSLHSIRSWVSWFKAFGIFFSLQFAFWNPEIQSTHHIELNQVESQIEWNPLPMGWVWWWTGVGSMALPYLWWNCCARRGYKRYFRRAALDKSVFLKDDTLEFKGRVGVLLSSIKLTKLITNTISPQHRQSADDDESTSENMEATDSQSEDAFVSKFKVQCLLHASPSTILSALRDSFANPGQASTSPDVGSVI